MRLKLGLILAISLASSRVFSRTLAISNPFDDEITDEPKLQTSLDQATLAQMFDEQVSSLIRVGYPRVLGRTNQEFKVWLNKLKAKLLDTPRALNKKEALIPFLIVIPRSLISISCQLKLGIKLKHSYGASLRNASAIKIPDQPYLLINLYWEHLEGTTARLIMEKIKHQTRRPVVMEEGMALVLHYPNILETYGIVAILGSRNREEREYFPILQGIEHNKILPGWIYLNRETKDSIAPTVPFMQSFIF